MMSDTAKWFEEMTELIDRMEKNIPDSEQDSGELNEFWLKLMNESSDADILFFQKLIGLAQQLVSGSIEPEEYHDFAQNLRKDFMEKYTGEEEG
jgi:hypothetical protein